jgi:hypothetical protein
MAVCTPAWRDGSRLPATTATTDFVSEGVTAGLDDDMPIALMDMLNVGLHLRFGAVQKQKRTESQLVGGVLTFGNAQAPIDRYQGPTSRKRLTTLPEPQEISDLPNGVIENIVDSAGEDQLLGNVSRGDRI